MKIGFPIEYNFGLESRVYEHFGSAPLFLLVDDDSLDFEALPNRHRRPGACLQLAQLLDRGCQGVVVEGIGNGAYHQLREAGVAVYSGSGMKIVDALAMLRSDRLAEVAAPVECRDRLALACPY